MIGPIDSMINLGVCALAGLLPWTSMTPHSPKERFPNDRNRTVNFVLVLDGISDRVPHPRTVASFESIDDVYYQGTE